MTDTITPPALRVALFQYATRFPVYEEIFAALRNSLRQAGASVRMVEAVADVGPERDDLLLIVGTPNYIGHLLQDLTTLRRRHGRAVRVFLWHLEHLPDLETPEPVLWALLLKNWLEARRAGGHYGNSRAANYHVIRQGARRGLFDQVYVFTPRKARFLEKHGVAAEYLPAGYHPIWGTSGSGERDIDVLFLGEVLEDRRGRIVKAVRAELEKEGVALKSMHDFNPNGLWGEERNAILQRSKIYLSVYRHAQDFSGTRFCLGMGNGALIVSEPVADPFPFVPGEHFVQAAVPDLGRAVLTYLRDEAGRVRICAEATRFITEDYTMHASAQRIVARARELAAGVDS
ncbi:MAG: glycosyltransferase family 1 protein [Armatimonadetes bacterium]|nr:glycosyltransferase family 1 protein [Armatimonadota bacterium]